jgi:ferritin-like metal-binding protein YciE
MSTKEPKDVFLTLLSDVRHNTERANKFYTELGNVVQDSELKEATESRALITSQALVRLDRCFSILGEKPVALTGRIQETFIEDFRRELGEIQGPVAKQLFVLAKLNHLANFRIGEYAVLTAAADLTGSQAVGSLLETCMADAVALQERTRRTIGTIIATRVSARRAA